MSHCIVKIRCIECFTEVVVQFDIASHAFLSYMAGISYVRSSLNTGSGMIFVVTHKKHIECACQSLYFI